MMMTPFKKLKLKQMKLKRPLLKLPSTNKSEMLRMQDKLQPKQLLRNRLKKKLISRELSILTMVSSTEMMDKELILTTVKLLEVLTITSK